MARPVTIGGGSQISMAQKMQVTGTVIAQSMNNTAQVNGGWLGQGVSIRPPPTGGRNWRLDQRGQSGIYRHGGSGRRRSQCLCLRQGGSYGGAGGGQAATTTYGSANAPVDLGSGGGVSTRVRQEPPAALSGSRSAERSPIMASSQPMAPMSQALSAQERADRLCHRGYAGRLGKLRREWRCQTRVNMAAEAEVDGSPSTTWVRRTILASQPRPRMAAPCKWKALRLGAVEPPCSLTRRCQQQCQRLPELRGPCEYQCPVQLTYGCQWREPRHRRRLPGGGGWDAACSRLHAGAVDKQRRAGEWACGRAGGEDRCGHGADRREAERSTQTARDTGLADRTRL